MKHKEKFKDELEKRILEKDMFGCCSDFLDSQSPEYVQGYLKAVNSVLYDLEITDSVRINVVEYLEQKKL